MKKVNYFNPSTATPSPPPTDNDSNGTNAKTDYKRSFGMF